MGHGLVSKYAFMPPHPSYNKSTPNLVFIPKKETSFSQEKTLNPVPALYYPAKTPTLPNGKPAWTVLFSHGNAEDLGQLQQWMQYLSTELNMNTLAYDYVGYGLNLPFGVENCSEENAYRDVEACYRWLLDVKAVKPERLILFGRSLGSGPTTGLAFTLSKQHSDTPLFGGVVLQSPLTSCVRVVSNSMAYIPFTDIFCNIDKIDKIRVPVMIAHGTNDTVVPFAHGEELSRKTKLPCSFHPINGAGHNDIEFSYLNEYMKYWRDFLQRLEDHQSGAK